MAKLTANGSTEVARWSVRHDANPDRELGQMVLCSDGRILRKSGIKGDGWTVAFRVGVGLRTEPDTVQRVLERRGYRLTRVWSR